MHAVPENKRLRIERRAKPLRLFLILRMFRIGQNREQLLVPGRAARIFRRTRAFAADQHRKLRHLRRILIKDVDDKDRVRPAITEVVGVREARTGVQRQFTDGDLHRTAHAVREFALFIRLRIAHTIGHEFVLMHIEPAERRLNAAMQLDQQQLLADQEITKDRRRDAIDADTERIVEWLELSTTEKIPAGFANGHRDPGSCVGSNPNIVSHRCVNNHARRHLGRQQIASLHTAVAATQTRVPADRPVAWPRPTLYRSVYSDPSPVPQALLSRAQVIDRLLGVIRQSGYDGASLSNLSAATGLGKSSLYHHFPDGKDDMVMAVLESLADQLRNAVFTPLRVPGTPKKRLDAMVKSVDAFYDGGDDPCILAQIALGSTRNRFRAPVHAIFADWMDAITDVLVDAKLPRAKARQRAEDAVMRIEGALILAAAMNDTHVFQRTMRTMTATLLA